MKFILPLLAAMCFLLPSCKETSSESAGDASPDAPPVANRDAQDPPSEDPAPDVPTSDAGELELVPIETKLPQAMFVGTPTNIDVPNLQEPLGHARPPFFAPRGTINAALGLPVSGSDEEPVVGELDLITDDDKDAEDGSFVEFGHGKQYITIDLGAAHDIYAVLVWHYHKQARVYYDVVVQVAGDADFITDVSTIFNNDHDNSSGLGTGSDMHYVETSEGQLIDAKGVQGRYVRLYSNGNTSNDYNHYIEVEVFGKPVT